LKSGQRKNISLDRRISTLVSDKSSFVESSMPIDPSIITIITGGSLIIIANLISYIKQLIKIRKEGREEKNGEMMFEYRDETVFVEPVAGTFDHIIQIYNHSLLFRIAVQLCFLLIMVLLLHNSRIL
jgi:hypothetical protein